MQHLEKYDMHEMQDDTKKCGMKDKQNKITLSHSAKARSRLSKINLIKQQLEKL